MTTFVGRHAELRRLLELVGEIRPDQPGRCVAIHGPAGEGKTRLIGELLRRAPMRALIYAAVPGDADSQRAAFMVEAQHSSLPRTEPFADILAPDWDTALRLTAGALDEEPAVVVLDNAHLLTEADPDFVSALRRVWSAHLVAKPVLLILAGREPLSAGPECESLPIGPFTPPELARVLGLDASAALESYLASGGHADIAAQWPTGADVPTAIEAMLSRSPSVFEIRAELAAVREMGAQERRMMEALGAEAASRVSLSTASGLPPASLDRALRALQQRGTIEVHRPLSSRPSREARYQLADPYLRTWARIIAPLKEEIARGRLDTVIEKVRTAWPLWRPAPLRTLVRGAMDRLARAGQLPGTAAVGGYWTRFEDVHVDLVGVDRDQGEVTFIGAIRWDRGAAFDHYDLASLIAVREKIPGATSMTPLVGVTLAGSAVGSGLAAVLGPGELLTAWQQ